jgi:dolichol-phosphate mannosyltransferase
MRLHPGWFLAPGIDIAVFLLANGLGGVSTERAQILSFATAVVLGYLPLLLRHPQTRLSGRSGELALHVAVVTLIAFFARSGVLISMHGWESGAHASIVIAAIATALLMHPAYAYCASSRAWHLGSGAGWQTGAIGIATAATVLRLVYSGRVELLPEETYYWNYAQHLDIGYLDHPPMVAWLIAAGTRLFGSGEFGVRIGALLSGGVATFFAYRLTDNLFGRSSALVALVLVQILPFLFVAGLLMTPDAPLTAAWVASLYFLERALVAGRRDAWWGAGICLGLGLLSKYTIVLVALSAFIFAIIDPQSRRWFRRPEPYAACLLALAVFSPVIAWNAQNHWVSFLFQTSRRLADRPQFALHKLIASVIVLLTPSGVAAAVWALTRGVRGGQSSPGSEDSRGEDGQRGRGWRFLQVATLTPLAVFVVFSLRHEVKLDWTGAPLLAAVPLLACGIVEGARGAAAGWCALLRASWVPTLIVLLLIYGAGLYDLTWGIPGVGYGKHAELVPVGWRELGDQVDAIAGRIGREGGQAPLVVGMDRYAIASELAFYTPDQARGVGRTSSGHLFGQVGLMYERWFPPAAETGRNLILVAWSREELLSGQVSSAAARMGPIQEGVLMRGKEVIRRYYYRVAYGYRGGARQGSAAN